MLCHRVMFWRIVLLRSSWRRTPWTLKGDGITFLGDTVTWPCVLHTGVLRVLLECCVMHRPAEKCLRWFVGKLSSVWDTHRNAVCVIWNMTRINYVLWDWKISQQGCWMLDDLTAVLLNTGGSHSSVAECWRISQQCCWTLEDLTAVLLSTGGSHSSVAEHWRISQQCSEHWRISQQCCWALEDLTAVLLNTGVFWDLKGHSAFVLRVTHSDLLGLLDFAMFGTV